MNAQIYTSTVIGSGLDDVGGQICYDWQSGHMLMFTLDLLITAVIVAADFILRIIVVVLIQWVHFRSLNVEYVIIQIILFVSQYLNNGLSLIMVGMNLDQIVGHAPYLDGDYPDFTSRWFVEIAPFFITPMLANI